MNENIPLPNNPPNDVIHEWNYQLEDLTIDNPEYINIRNYLLKNNWSLESCRNVLSSIASIKMNNYNKDIILFLTNNCCFHLHD